MPPMPAPGYVPQGPTKLPRARAKVGGTMLLVAVAAVVAGCFLPWVTSSAGDLNGFDNYYCDDSFDCIGSSFQVEGLGAFNEDVTQLESPAVLAMIGAVLLAAFAITLIAAGRILAIAIIALIASSFGVLAALLFMAVAAGTEYVDSTSTPADGISIGVILQLLGALLAVAACIVTLVQRRRPVTAY